MQKPRRAIVIHSPHSGRYAQLSLALAYLQTFGLDLAKVISIAELDNQPPQGPIWKEQGIDLVVAAGGDGLIGGVITHIAESGLSLGILPLGTANDIARSLAVPQDVRLAAQVIADGNTQEIDIGKAVPAHQTPEGNESAGEIPSKQTYGYFAHTLTVGLNVEFARLATNVATRQRFGRFTYPLAALEVLKSHQAVEVELHFEGVAVPARPLFLGQSSAGLIDAEKIRIPLRCRAAQVTIINAPIFGGQWQLSIPQASLNDRLLDIVVIEDFEFSRLNTALSRFFNHQQPPRVPLVEQEPNEAFVHHPAELTGIPGIHHIQAQRVGIHTVNASRDVTLDGEVRGKTPVTVQIAEQRLHAIVPE